MTYINHCLVVNIVKLTHNMCSQHNKSLNWLFIQNYKPATVFSTNNSTYMRAYTRHNKPLKRFTTTHNGLNLNKRVQILQCELILQSIHLSRSGRYLFHEICCFDQSMKWRHRRRLFVRSCLCRLIVFPYPPHPSPF